MQDLNNQPTAGLTGRIQFVKAGVQLPSNEVIHEPQSINHPINNPPSHTSNSSQPLQQSDDEVIEIEPIPKRPAKVAVPLSSVFGAEPEAPRPVKRPRRELDSFLEELKQKQSQAASEPIPVIPRSSNLRVSNLGLNVTENDLIHEFSRFGDLASVKIMYPRSDRERFAESMTGFVCFMHENDGVSAVQQLDRTSPFGPLRIRVEFSKAIVVPTKPIALKRDPNAKAISDRDRWAAMLAALTPSRKVICEAMFFVMDHSAQATDLVRQIIHHWKASQISSHRVALMFLLHDLQHNAALHDNAPLKCALFIDCVVDILDIVGLYRDLGNYLFSPDERETVKFVLDTFSPLPSAARNQPRR